MTVFLPIGSIMEWNNNRITDHNRSAVSIDDLRIEVQKRMANGTYRRWVTAVKKQFSFSYTNVPSKTSKTVDGAWGGEDMEAFYNANSTFQLKVRQGDGSIDTYTAVITSFSVDVVKRGPNSDLWDISIEIEEV